MGKSRLTYTVCHEAFYWEVTRVDRIAAELMVHREALTDDGHEDGVHWEFGIRWIDLGHSHGLSPRVEMFDDSWAAFHEIPEIFGRLAKMAGEATPEAVAAMLDSAGFTDVTERENPYIAPR